MKGLNLSISELPTVAMKLVGCVSENYSYIPLLAVIISDKRRKELISAQGKKVKTALTLAIY